MRALFSFVILVSSFFAQAQTKREWLEYADEAFERKDYTSAAEYYARYLDTGAVKTTDGVYPYDIRYYYKTETKEDKSGEAKPANLNALIDPRYPYVSHQLAESYRLSYNYEQAEKWYDRSIQNGLLYPDDRFWYAKMLLMNAKYDVAYHELEWYRKRVYNQESEMAKRAELLSFSCELGMRSKNKKTPNTQVTELDTLINKGVANFSPAYFDKGGSLVFTSARRNPGLNAPMNCDLYLAGKNGETFGDATRFPMPVNTIQHEGGAFVNADQTKLLFTRWSNEKKEETAIYLSRYLNDQWMQPLKLNKNVNLDGYRSAYPYLTADGTKLYFSSNRPGGKGKMDLWYCHLDEFGNAGPAINLSVLNSFDDDVSPYLNEVTNTLYFSSDGQLGFGGLDVFKAYASDTNFIAPRNMGPGINSSRDESSFIISDDERSGFFSSDRKNCTECVNSHCYSIYSFKTVPFKLSISGFVYNKETNQIIANSLVALKDVEGTFEDQFVITDDKGHYSTILREEQDLFMKAQKTKYFADAFNMSTKGVTETKEYIHDFYLKPIPAGEIVIPGIEYDYDKATLRPQSKEILEGLIEFLKLNNNIIVEISSHTDARGSDEYNMRLSEERAKSVVDYLILQGIESERLKPKGYGESKLLVEDAKTEEEHQKNRRTAFRILSEDFKPAKQYKIPEKKE
jgi:OmpA-OmpF porin, OOP family